MPVHWERHFVRLEKILTIAVLKEYRYLVRDAWGCGVFQNDPVEIANFFKQQLLENVLFKNRFEKVVFAVLDSSLEQTNLRPFQLLFGN